MRKNASKTSSPAGSQSMKLTKTSPQKEIAHQGFITDVAAVWNDLQAIRSQFGKDLSDIEFKFFVGLGMMLGANPFLGEIWSIKYGKSPASIFCGRNLYRRKANEHPDFQRNMTQPVYANDVYELENGVLKHQSNLKDRGKLIGAYSMTWKKSTGEWAAPHFVDFWEYYKGHRKPDGKIKKTRDNNGNWVDMKPTTWDTMPVTMIQKVAQSQDFRDKFPELFQGTYDESEQWLREEPLDVTNEAEVIEDVAPATQNQDLQLQLNQHWVDTNGDEAVPDNFTRIAYDTRHYYWHSEAGKWISDSEYENLLEARHDERHANAGEAVEQPAKPKQSKRQTKTTPVFFSRKKVN